MSLRAQSRLPPPTYATFNSTGVAGSGQFERKFATSSPVGSASGSYRVYYQIVATDNQNQVIQRSSTYSDLTIEKCP
jgi:hypothetical protein